MDDIEYIAVPAKTAKAIDFLEKLAIKRSDTGKVTSSADWKIVVELFKVWKDMYPNDYEWFRESAAKYKQAHTYNKGFAKEGTGLVQHQLEIPEKFDQLLNVMFPAQSYEQDFVQKLMRELPLLDVSKD